MFELVRGQALPGIGAELELSDRLRRTKATTLGRLEPDRLRLNAGQGAIANAQTVPQVFVGGRLIGGAEALESWLAQSR